MERNQAETTGTLQDVVKSNMDLQSMLKSYISSFTGTNNGAFQTISSQEQMQCVGGSENKVDGTHTEEKKVSRPGSSEDWWDKLEKSTVDEANVTKNVVCRSDMKSTEECKVM